MTNVTSSTNIVDLSSDPSVAAFTATLTEAAQEASQQGVVLTPVARKHLFKMRTNSEGAAGDIFAMAQTYGVSLPDYPVTQGQTDLATVSRIKPLAAAAAAFDQAMRDDLLVKQSAVWQAATTLYTALQVLAVRTPALQAELTVLTGFFATKKVTQASKAAAKLAKNGPAPVAGTAGTGTPGAGTSSNPPAANSPVTLVVPHDRRATSMHTVQVERRHAITPVVVA